MLRHDFKNKAHFVKTLHTVHISTHTSSRTSQIFCKMNTSFKTLHNITKPSFCYRMIHTWFIQSDSVWTYTLLCSILNTCNISTFLMIQSGVWFFFEILLKNMNSPNTIHETSVAHWWKYLFSHHIVKSFSTSLQLGWNQNILLVNTFSTITKKTLASSLHVSGYGHFVHITGNVLPRKTAREDSSRMATSSLPRLCIY